MKHEIRLTLIDTLNAEVRQVLNEKSLAYAGDGGDTLANFKRNAERLGLTKYQIWGVYFNKHIDSINNAIMQHPDGPIDRSEGLKSRIIDVKNYIDILYCLLAEDELINNP